MIFCFQFIGDKIVILHNDAVCAYQVFTIQVRTTRDVHKFRPPPIRQWISFVINEEEIFLKSNKHTEGPGAVNTTSSVDWRQISLNIYCNPLKNKLHALAHARTDTRVRGMNGTNDKRCVVCILSDQRNLLCAHRYYYPVIRSRFTFKNIII